MDSFEQWDEDQAWLTAEAEKGWAILYAQMTTPIERAVMELHRPDGKYCPVCGNSDGMGVEWPECRTVDAIREALGRSHA